MKRQVTLTLITALLALTLVQCRDKREEPIPPTPTPTPTPTPGTEKVYITAEMLLIEEDGKETVVAKTQNPAEMKLVGEGIGIITGIGEHNKGNTASLAISEDHPSLYTLQAFYEKDGKGGLTKGAKPVLTEGKATRDVKVVENMHLIAVYKKEKQPELKFRHIYDHDYWVRKNKEAYDHIKPKVVYIERLDEVPLFREMTLFRTHAELQWLLTDKTIYREEASAFFWIYERFDYDKVWRTQRFEDAWRHTYALEDMSGNIVEIYPPANMPVVNLGYFLHPTRWNYVTVPEGRYRVVCLFNTPDNRNVWYRIPFVDTFGEGEAHYGAGIGWQYGAPIPPEKSWRKEQDIIEVKDRRTHNITTPLFEVAKPLGGVTPEEAINSLTDFDFEVTLVNVTNQALKGKIIPTDEFRPWIHPDGIEYLNTKRRLKDERYIVTGGWGDQTTPWKKECGEPVPVVLEPNGETRVTIRIRDCMRPFDRARWGFQKPQLVLYWEDENGNRDLIRNTRREVTSVMEKNDWGTIGAHFWNIFPTMGRFKNPNVQGTDDQFLYNVYKGMDEKAKMIGFGENCII